MIFVRPKAAAYKGAELLLMSLAMEDRFENMSKQDILETLEKG